MQWYNTLMESNPHSVFDLSFRSLIANMLRRCRYVKDLERLLAPENDFRVRWNRQEILLEHYYLDPDDSGQFTGAGYELTYHLGQSLKQQLGNRFLFLAADGNCPQFYFEEHTTHTFIVAFPRFLFAQIVQQLQQTVGQIPPNVYVIDPLFGSYGESNVDDAVSGYRVKYAYDFEEIRPSPGRSETLPFHWFENGYGQTPILPIGLSQYLLPGIHQVDENQLIVVGFQFKPDHDPCPQVLLGSKKSTESYPSIRKDLEELLPPQHALKRFLERLRRDLASPPFG
jgi:hypothetical protein